MSVAYGNQVAGVEGVELSLGEIAQSSDTVCGRRADSRVNLAGVASARHDLENQGDRGARKGLVINNRRWREVKAECLPLAGHDPLSTNHC
jgi:hypothetical protein